MYIGVRVCSDTSVCVVRLSVSRYSRPRYACDWIVDHVGIVAALVVGTDLAPHLYVLVYVTG